MEKIKNKLQADLDASTFEIAENENEEAQQSATSDSVACDNINWEQRRWELASALFRRCYGSASIEMADDFIEEYKKSLNTEE